MSDDPYADRKKLTFAQAEGAEPLPQQLALKELSQQLRALLWHIVHRSMEKAREYPTMGGKAYFNDPWKSVLYIKHVFRDHRMADDFRNAYSDRVKEVRLIIENGSYVEVLDFVGWLLSTKPRTLDPNHVRHALEFSRAAYRLLDDDVTIVPVAAGEDAATLNRAFADLGADEFAGAREHLRAAGVTSLRGKLLQAYARACTPSNPWLASSEVPTRCLARFSG